MNASLFLKPEQATLNELLTNRYPSDSLYECLSDSLTNIQNLSTLLLDLSALARYRTQGNEISNNSLAGVATSLLNDTQDAITLLEAFTKATSDKIKSTNKVE